MCPLGVYENISIAITRPRLRERHLLMPAVHTANGVGLNREGQVLRHAALSPPDALGIRIGTGERTWSFNLPDKPFPRLLLRDFHNVGTVAIARRVLAPTPAAEV